MSDGLTDRRLTTDQGPKLLSEARALDSPSESNPQQGSQSDGVMVGWDELKPLFPAWSGAFGDGPSGL